MAAIAHPVSRSITERQQVVLDRRLSDPEPIAESARVMSRRSGVAQTHRMFSLAYRSMPSEQAMGADCMPPRVRHGIQFIELDRGQGCGELRVTGDDDVGLLLWAAQWLDDDYVITAIRFKVCRGAKE